MLWETGRPVNVGVRQERGRAYLNQGSGIYNGIHNEIM